MIRLVVAVSSQVHEHRIYIFLEGIEITSSDSDHGVNQGAVLEIEEIVVISLVPLHEVFVLTRTRTKSLHSIEGNEVKDEEP